LKKPTQNTFARPQFRQSENVLRRNLAEQKEEVFLENENVQCGIFLALSNAGKYLACFNSRKNQIISEKFSAEIVLILTEDKSIKFMQVDGNRIHLRFSPDSKAVDFTANAARF